MNARAPKPLSVTGDTVTIGRADWDALLDRLEDIADRESVVADMAERARIGEEEHRRLAYSADEVARMIDGVSRIVIWRDRRTMSQRALAEAAGISPSYLAEIERGQKPGSLAAMAAIARVFRIPIEHLVA